MTTITDKQASTSYYGGVFIDEDEIVIKAKYQKMYTEKYKQDMDFVIIGDNCIGPFVDMDVAQKAVSAINSQFMPQPKRTRTECEKVTESIFDLRDEFERGELYSKHKNKEKYYQINAEVWVVSAMSNNNLYRKVEKEIDWRDEVHECLGGTEFHWSTPIAEVINAESDCFLELCRVALRANGEL